MEDGATLGVQGRLIALAAGPAVAGIAWLSLGGAGLTPEGRWVCALAVLMAAWWLTEALPLAATSLLPLAVLPLAGVMPGDRAAAPYADKIVFLFMGGFMLQQAMQKWNLHQRIALWTMLAVGTRPRRLILGVMTATATLSMWVSNTACAAMMLPIGVSICQLLMSRAGEETEPGRLPRDRQIRNFAVCMMLAIASSATIGGLATPVGTPPNLLGVAYLRDKLGVEVTFVGWMAVCVPVSVVLLGAAWVLLTRVVFPVRLENLPGGREFIRRELHALGPFRLGEGLVMGVFACTALCWIFRQPLCDALELYRVSAAGKREYTVLEDHTIAIVAALVLFALPTDLKRGEFVLDWKHASRLPLGVLLLFGGGLSLAAAFSATGVDRSIGQALAGLSGLPPWLVLVIATAAAVFLSEFVSNTALVATFLPIVHGAAGAMGLDPAVLVLPLALGASTAFMLPAGTPPNAIVFSSGYLTVAQMARFGVLLNLLSIALVSAALWWFGWVIVGVR